MFIYLVYAKLDLNAFSKLEKVGVEVPLERWFCHRQGCRSS